ncbi:tumor necrosis factor ligand superfamily member 14 [Hoplias malabaricus]|uniref:tumor necrosis factor ligand superfamily member 14 n=1 Tax=Hoplias malabaricus TaxID=27720 RepID=UPI0034633244
MAKQGVEYPSVFVVDSRAGLPPLPPKPGQRLALRQRSKYTQTLLCLLVFMALFGIMVEACFIYDLYKSKHGSEPVGNEARQSGARKGDVATEEFPVQPRTRPPAFKKPSKPLAHLIAGSKRPDVNGVMPWNDEVEHVLYELDYKEGKLVVQKEGYYFIYSQLCFDADEVSFNHLVTMTTPRYSSPDPIELLRYRYRGAHSKAFKKTGTLKSSYLGGVFHLFKDDAVFVLVRNGTVLLQSPGENYFGMFML